MSAITNKEKTTANHNQEAGARDFGLNMMLKEYSISAGTAAILVKDPSLSEEGQPFLTWLREEGFQPWGHHAGFACDWLWINLNSKIYARGMAGIRITKEICGHAITTDEFKTIWGIFKKYENKSPLQMD